MKSIANGCMKSPKSTVISERGCISWSNLLTGCFPYTTQLLMRSKLIKWVGKFILVASNPIYVCRFQ